MNKTMPKLKNPNSKRRRKGEATRCTCLSLEKFVYQYLRQYDEEEAKRRNWRYWPELPRDVMQSVLERLSLRDLQRAKSVCSAWLCASRQCAPKSQVPWVILFPQENNRCKLFNPEEKDKMYTSQDMGVGFAESVCLATHGCWLLMRNPLFNLYIVNLLTGQRINLPPSESQRGQIKLERIGGDMFRATRLIGSVYHHADTKGFEIISPRLWADDETKDYLVIFSLRVFSWSSTRQYAVICKQGQHLWTQIPDYCSPCSDMVYKHQKLYLYRFRTIQIFDFSSSGELRQAPETHVYVASFSLNPYHLPLTRLSVVEKTNIVVTVGGHVLVAVSVLTSCKTWSFGIYKMCSWANRWDKLHSLDDEAMLLDLGITVPAKDIEGISENSIYFSGLGQDENDIFIYDISTGTIQRPHQSVCSSLEQYSRARWFFPGFSRKIN